MAWVGIPQTSEYQINDPSNPVSPENKGSTKMNERISIKATESCLAADADSPELKGLFEFGNYNRYNRAL